MRFALALLLAVAACGSRTQLDVPHGAPDGGACASFPPIPPVATRPIGEACAFGGGPAFPALAAVAGQELLLLSSQGVFTDLFHFSVAPTVAQRVVARGDYVGALVTGLQNDALSAELVVVETDGTVLVDDHETSPQGSYFTVAGNAGGTFAFSAFGNVWLAARGTLLGPFDGATLPWLAPDPDANGRELVLPQDTSHGVYAWLDPCTRSVTPAVLVNGSPWRGGLFGLSKNGQPSMESAEGVVALPTPSLGGDAFPWAFTQAGVAMIAVPPPPSGLTASLVTLDVTTSVTHAATLAYPPGLQPAGGAFLSEVGDSNDPAGFGVDSAGRVTMFLWDAKHVAHLYVTKNGADWTPIGDAVTADPMFEPSYSLQYAEAAGTFVVQGDAPMQGRVWHVVRPAANVDVAIGGQGLIASDGGCVAALVTPTRLDVVQATTGTVTSLTLPVAANPQTWASTWMTGDDALWVQY
jgi:hypothetical protein